MSDVFDVIVVGFGFAGGIAAIEAHDAGARVLIVEKQPDPGGISVCSAGGIRVAEDAAAALAYLGATNAGTTPEPVLEKLARGMLDIQAFVEDLAAPIGARVGRRAGYGNYPLPGYRTFGFVTVDDIPGFDPIQEFPSVRGSAAGTRLFKLVLESVRRRPGISVRLATAAQRLVMSKGEVAGIVTDDGVVSANRAVVLASGGFEAAEELKRQLWLLKPVRSAAVRSNTGDGMAMAQAVGAGLWHLWHYHGSYGFEHPDPRYPYGIRLKRLPDWVPGESVREDVRMSWILVDQCGRRFVNEYEPYLQDTGHRAMEYFDPVRQSFPRVPAYLVVDSAGRKLYPLSAPTWHDVEVAQRFGSATPATLDEAILKPADTLQALAAKLNIPGDALAETVAAWNAACLSGSDDLSRARRRAWCRSPRRHSSARRSGPSSLTRKAGRRMTKSKGS